MAETRPLPVPLFRVGYVFEERYLWHQSSASASSSRLLQPSRHYESPESKQRFHSLLAVSGLDQQLVRIRARPATRQELHLVHTKRYINEVEAKSQRPEGGLLGEDVSIAQHGFDIASLSAGGVLEAVDAVMQGKIDSAYTLTRPPGHHALPDRGMGFCVFNNVAIAAKFLQQQYPGQVRRIAIVDYDVHHGNGTQDVFYKDPSVLYVSLHQAGNYPLRSGHFDDIGAYDGEGTTVNVPLPPGSGAGAYEYAFEQVVVPAVRRFQPDFVLVSSGFDASYADPLSAMILGSQTFRFMATHLIAVAQETCDGRIVFIHEGGYSETYVPFCGAAVIEALLGIESKTEQLEDPFLEEVEAWEYQELQEHQRQIIEQVGALHRLEPVSLDTTDPDHFALAQRHRSSTKWKKWLTAKKPSWMKNTMLSSSSKHRPSSSSPRKQPAKSVESLCTERAST